MNEIEMIREIRELADRFSEGWHEGVKIDASDVVLLSNTATALEQLAALKAERDAAMKDAERMRDALRFYADGDHFAFDRNAWDTVSDEPQNFWCDAAETATVEDGTIAKLALSETATAIDAAIAKAEGRTE